MSTSEKKIKSSNNVYLVGLCIVLLMSIMVTKNSKTDNIDP